MRIRLIYVQYMDIIAVGGWFDSSHSPWSFVKGTLFLNDSTMQLSGNWGLHLSSVLFHRGNLAPKLLPAELYFLRLTGHQPGKS